MEDLDEEVEEYIRLKLDLMQITLSHTVSDSIKGRNYILQNLYMHGGAGLPKLLAKDMRVSTARIAKILNDMEADGMITRHADPKDNRQTVVKLTDLGIERAVDCREKLRQDVRHLFEKLGEEDTREYLRLQKKILKIADEKN